TIWANVMAVIFRRFGSINQVIHWIVLLKELKWSSLWLVVVLAALLLRLVVAPRLCFLGFFFFQAEDGIRDATVTGVQTCALPILDFPSLQYARKSTRLGRIPAAAVFRVPTQSECRRSEAAHLAFLPVLLSTRHS